MKNCLKEKLFILFVFLSGSILSQNETNNWYFGENSGIDFSDGLVTVVNDSDMNTPAGCSSISDKDGNLLFYTNGESVWNRNHTLIDNGTGLAGVVGNNQSTIIIPKPGSQNVYYIFTTREHTSTSPPSFSSGVYYSTIEFSPQNPLGAITVKNQALSQASTERITAIHHTESNSIRVIGFAASNGIPETPKDTFYIFSVTENGVEQNPAKITTLSADYSGSGMKISPDGTRIALLDFKNGSGFIYLYFFDNDSLSITFEKQILVDGFFNPMLPYSVEFSQDSRILYFTAESVPNKNDFLFKYDLYNTSIFYVKVIITTSDEFDFGTLQLARNGKIYLANYLKNSPLNSVNHISVIEDPENTLDYNNIVSLVNLESGNSFKGLPNFIPSLLRNRIVTENQCQGDSFDFSLDSYAPIDSVLWDFGDGNTSTDLNPTHTYYAAGDVKVQATVVINNYSTIFYKDIKVHPLPVINPDEVISQCDADNDGLAFFNLNTINEKILDYNLTDELSFYNTLEDAEAGRNAIDNTETYQNLSNPQELFVNIKTEYGCSTISNFFIEANYETLGGTIEPMYTCETSDEVLNNNEGKFYFSRKITEIRDQFNIPNSSTLTFYRTFQDAQTEINALDLTADLASTTIWVRVENQNSGCNGIEPITMIVNSAIEMNLDDEYTICDASVAPPTVLDGGFSNDTWEWRDSNDTLVSSERQFILNQPGKYTLTASRTENGLQCYLSKEFTVNQASTASFREIEIEGRQVTISVEGESNYEFSLDNISYFGEGTDHIFSDVEPGVYTIYVRDKKNCESSIEKAISLIHYPKFLTPNGDGYNDSWRVYGINDDVYSSAEISIFDRYGKKLYKMTLDNNKFGWDGTLNGEMLLSTDYWFKVTLVDKEDNVFTRAGHFSLRN